MEPVAHNKDIRRDHESGAPIKDSSIVLLQNNKKKKKTEKENLKNCSIIFPDGQLTCVVCQNMFQTHRLLQKHRERANHFGYCYYFCTAVHVFVPDLVSARCFQRGQSIKVDHRYEQTL